MNPNVFGLNFTRVFRFACFVAVALSTLQTPFVASSQEPGQLAGKPQPGPRVAPSAAGASTLVLKSGFFKQEGLPDPLGGHPYVLLKEPLSSVLTKSGITIPADSNAYKVRIEVCASHKPECKTIIDAIKASTVAYTRADMAGTGTFSGLVPGTYFLMVAAHFNNKWFKWDQAVLVRPGNNAFTLGQQNATLME